MNWILSFYEFEKNFEREIEKVSFVYFCRNLYMSIFNKIFSRISKNLKFNLFRNVYINNSFVLIIVFLVVYVDVGGC